MSSFNPNPQKGSFPSSRGCLQTQYKKCGRQEAGSSLYSVMAETLDTQHAKQASQIQSQVLTPTGSEPA